MTFPTSAEEISVLPAAGGLTGATPVVSAQNPDGTPGGGLISLKNVVGVGGAALDAGTSIAGTDTVLAIVGGLPKQVPVSALPAPAPAGFTRPALADFTAFGVVTGSTVTYAQTEPGGAAGPIIIDATQLSGSYQASGIQQAVSGTEWMLTALVDSPEYDNNNNYVGYNLGMVDVNGASFFIYVGSATNSPNGTNGLIFVSVNSNPTNFYGNPGEQSPGMSYRGNRNWFRIYYKASASPPYTILRSHDGYAWVPTQTWDGTTDNPNSGVYTAIGAIFAVNPHGAGRYVAALYHWDIKLGTGSSLNPLAPTSPL